jgi:hypothetical protein
MTVRTTLLIGGAWILSLFAVGAWAQGGAGANAQQPRIIQPGEPHGVLITSENLAFQRFAGQPSQEGRIVGKLMVRVNGQWLEAEPPVRVVRTPGQ